TIQDINNCTITTSATIAEPDALSVIPSVEDASCNGTSDGSVILVVSGGTAPYEYSLDGITYQPINEFTDLAAGNYSITVRDARGCLEAEDIVVAEPAEMLMTLDVSNVSCFGEADGEIEISVSGGTPAYRYSLDGENF